MKKKNWTYIIVLCVLVAAVGVYLSVYAVKMLKSPLRTAQVVKYTAKESVQASGYVVRDEKLLKSDVRLVEPVLSSGDKAAKGELIARGYLDESTQSSVREIEDLEEKLRQIEQTINSSSSSSGAASIESDVSDAILELAKLRNTSSLSHTEKAAEKLRTLLLRKAYLYGGAQGLEQTAVALRSEIAWLKDSENSSSTELTADQSGVFSSETDGYESVLNSAVLEGMTLEDYDSLPSAGTDVGQGVYGKLIYSDTWRFVTAVSSDLIQGLDVSDEVNVMFTGTFDGSIKMTVERMDSEGDRTLLILSGNKMLYAVTDVRYQPVEITFGEYEGLRIPVKALTMKQEEGEDVRYGVYCLDGMVARFKEVTIIKQTGDYYVVEQKPEDPYALRVGNEIITNLKDIYEGKVLR